MFQLLSLFEVLAAPIASAMYQEFGHRHRDRPARCDEPQRLTPQAESSGGAEPAAAVKCNEAEFSATEPEFSAIQRPAECGATPEVAPATPDVATPAVVQAAVGFTPPEAAEPLFVRRGEGKASRYLLASESMAGPRFRRVVAGRRTKYTPCEEMRR